MTAPVLGPCTSWITADDVRSCCTIEETGTTADELLDRLGVAASQVLYELSGRRFSGLCTSVVRPCQTQACGINFLPGLGYAVPSWGWSWNGLGSGWQDTGIGNAGVQCGCSPLATVLLGYPTVEVTEVLIDGLVVDPSTYRVDEWRYLIAVADSSTTPPTPRYWPSCQDLTVDATEPGTFQVTYTHGVAPPAIGIDAAAQLACQFFQQCSGGGAECVLPLGATRITRQGVTIERGLLASWFLSNQNGGGWSTGLGMVDAFLTAYNPSRLRRAPAVFTPDLTRMPRTTSSPPGT